MTDWELLKHYIDTKSDKSFAQLVERHLKTVYFTCRRELHSDQLAEDAAQLVFLLLADKARNLSPNVSISGWLFNSAVWISKDMYRREIRSAIRDTKAVNMTSDQDETTEFQRQSVAHWINEGLSSLRSPDRDAIVMRYLDELDMCEIASVMNMTEESARKRISRAIGKLRDYFERKEVGLTQVVLVNVLSEQHVGTLPRTCMVSVISSVHSLTMTSGTVAHSTLRQAFWRKGIYIVMETAKRKLLIGAVVSAVLLGGIGVPVSQYCIARAYDNKVNTLVGRGGFTDDASAAGNTTPGTKPSQADRQAIVNNYVQLANDFNNNKLQAVYGLLTPNTVYGTFGSTLMRTPQQYLGGQEGYLATHKYVKIYYVLKSINEIDGDIVTTDEIRFVSQATKDDSEPAGSIVTQDAMVQDQWDSVGGTWHLAKSIPTAVISTDRLVR